MGRSRISLTLNPGYSGSAEPLIGRPNGFAHAADCDVDCRKPGAPAPTLAHARGRKGHRPTQREAFMAQRNGSIRIALLAGRMLAAAAPALAADVSPQRLLNPHKEPENWPLIDRT